MTGIGSGVPLRIDKINAFEGRGEIALLVKAYQAVVPIRAFQYWKAQ